ncbi:MAG: hypothetical protein ABEJ31_02400 [Haloarculaceae archaeon]
MIAQVAIWGVELGRYADLFLWILQFIETVLLLVTSLFLLYPLVRYAENVAHERGLGLLAAAFLLLSVRWATAYLPVPPVVPAACGFAAALSIAAGSWTFARSFVDTAERVKLAQPQGEPSGGGFGRDEHE